MRLCRRYLRNLYRHHDFRQTVLTLDEIVASVRIEPDMPAEVDSMIDDFFVFDAAVRHIGS